MRADEAPNEEQLLQEIMAATGVDIVGARFMLGLHRGHTTGDVMVAGDLHFDPPAVELSSGSVTIVRSEAGATFAVAQPGRDQVVWSEDGPLVLA